MVDGETKQFTPSPSTSKGRCITTLRTGRPTPSSAVDVAGRAHVERVYRAALNAGYLWHEFGDLHLIAPA
ncbi:MAG: hypothetical protein A2V59_04520 [Armatimonadetes bacterium RBG_19FT_COMBO_69_19]|nr:MAG: hypothetical protein A2V59_04520 [Armatimonadetes bacterium RBG_19FT_COMBO_69_19]